MALSNTRLCETEGCQTIVLKPRRKCTFHLVKPRKVTQGRPINKGRNARGIAAHKPDKIRTRRAKRQNPEMMNRVPYMTGGKGYDPAKSIRKPNEKVW